MRVESLGVRLRHGAMIVAAACGLAASLGGCVVSVGNERSYTVDRGPRQKIYLSAEERETLPNLTTTADIPTFAGKYASTLAGMGPATTQDEFLKAFPTAQFVERRTTSVGSVDAYRVETEEKFRYRYESYGWQATYTGWFFFKDGKLLKWRETEQWP
jgi:hypothetical protein